MKTDEVSASGPAHRFEEDLKGEETVKPGAFLVKTL
jgi:hypothetical protein